MLCLTPQMAGTNFPTPTPRKNLASGNWFCHPSMTNLQLWIITPNSRWRTKHLHTYFLTLSRCHHAMAVWGLVTVMYSVSCVASQVRTLHVTVNNMPYSQHVKEIIVCAKSARWSVEAPEQPYWQLLLPFLSMAGIPQDIVLHLSVQNTACGVCRWLVFSSSK